MKKLVFVTIILIFFTVKISFAQTKFYFGISTQKINLDMPNDKVNNIGGMVKVSFNKRIKLNATYYAYNKEFKNAANYGAIYTRRKSVFSTLFGYEIVCFKKVNFGIDLGISYVDGNEKLIQSLNFMRNLEKNTYELKDVEYRITSKKEINPIAGIHTNFSLKKFNFEPYLTFLSDNSGKIETNTGIGFFFRIY